MASPRALAVDREVGVPVRYRGMDGEHLVDLADVAVYPFESGPGWRPLVSYKGQRNFVGKWWFCSSGSFVGYESWVERDEVMLLDRDPDVVAIRSQPFELVLETGRHVPDYYVRHTDGSVLVVDVRPDSGVTAEATEVFAATKAACELVGWSYARVGELDSVTRANVRWLSHYRHPRCADQGMAWRHMTNVLARAGSVALGSVPGLCGVDPVVLLPHLYHRLWRRDLAVDETTLLSQRSLVALTRGQHR